MVVGAEASQTGLEKGNETSTLRLCSAAVGGGRAVVEGGPLGWGYTPVNPYGWKSLWPARIARSVTSPTVPMPLIWVRMPRAAYLATTGSVCWW